MNGAKKWAALWHCVWSWPGPCRNSEEGRNYKVTLEKTQLSCVFPGLEGAICILGCKRLQQPTQRVLKETCVWKEAQAHWVLSEQGYCDLFWRTGEEAGKERALRGCRSGCARGQSLVTEPRGSRVKALEGRFPSLAFFAFLCKQLPFRCCDKAGFSFAFSKTGWWFVCFCKILSYDLGWREPSNYLYYLTWALLRGHFGSSQPMHVSGRYPMAPRFQVQELSLSSKPVWYKKPHSVDRK